ncbi:MAG: outer membrane protein assembly factor BamD [Bacteroidales bacterium]
MFKKAFYVVLFLAAIMAVSCSSHQKLLKSTDNEKKYEVAIELYEKGDYYRALQLFDQLIPVYRGTNEAEKLYYYYADAYFHEEDYILASYYFKRFVTSFPGSEFAQEAAFMAAYCKYLDSPRYSLDQTVTREAIDEFQLFINRYPFSERADEANMLIDELRDKLQKKAYNVANLYMKMEDYRAAIVSYENLLKDYPDTEYREEILYNIISSYYQYAQKSIEERQKERYESAVKAYLDFIDEYPESEYYDEVLKMRERVQQELKKIDTTELQ